jgi:thymidylate synthase ThyX
MIEAAIIADSISQHGIRLTTIQCKYPRMILPEVLTHRKFSRNTSSSRAIPTSTYIKRMIEDPAMPEMWGKNQKGMQAEEFYTSEEIGEIEKDWLELRDIIMSFVKERFVDKWNLHKQIANRPLETFLHTYQVITATDWENFFNLRRHPDAQPEIHAIADAMWEAMVNSVPRMLCPGEWHLPYILEEDTQAGHSINTLLKVATARCARVSYKTHDGQKTDIEKDIQLHDMLLSSGHNSPLEHAAYALETSEYFGNFRGWMQYRKTIPGEAVFSR